MKIKENKSFKRFLTEQEGKIAKEDIKKIGLTLLVLGISFSGLMKPDRASGDCCSHTSHGSHGSHGSHSRGGWC